MLGQRRRDRASVRDIFSAPPHTPTPARLLGSIPTVLAKIARSRAADHRGLHPGTPLHTAGLPRAAPSARRCVEIIDDQCRTERTAADRPPPPTASACFLHGGRA
jgi:hypothetical protein